MQKPITDRLGEAYDSPEKVCDSPHSLYVDKCYNYVEEILSIVVFLQEELALQLCWAIGEHGGGGASHKDAARELFESLELLLYENLSSRYDLFYCCFFTCLLSF